MTANPTVSTNGHTSSTEKSKIGRGPNKSGKQGRGRGRSRQSAAGKGNNNQGLQGSTSRFMSQGRQALGDAYGWASESAGRALPRAARYIPGQGKMRSMLEDRPLVIGAIGLGLGALIGMMLPSRTLNMLGTKRPNRRRSGQSNKKS